ncbi:MAG: hypothetical protein CMN78_04020 [Spirochaetales bacterium]|nr:hypothetical protein [Spirochaetales bacterium]
MGRDALIIFFKPPVPGIAKTRLARDMGSIGAARMYGAMVRDLANATIGADYQVIPMCSSHDTTFEVPWAQWLIQDKGDIGQRMNAAFISQFSAGYNNVLLVGTDIPGLDAGIIQSCFTGIYARGMALGPAADGGYYAIGFSDSVFHPDYFSGIEWSTAEVFAATMNLAKAYNVAPFVGPRLRDIDTIKDLEQVLEELPTGRAPHLKAELQNLYGKETPR